MREKNPFISFSVYNDHSQVPGHKTWFSLHVSSRTRSTQGRQFLPGFTGDLHHSAWWVWNVRRKSLFPGRTLQDPKLLRKGHEQPVTTVLKRCAMLLGAPNFPNPRLLDGELLKRKKRKCFYMPRKKKNLSFEHEKKNIYSSKGSASGRHLHAAIYNGC